MSAERLFMVHLKGGEPGDKAYEQPVRATSGDVVDSCLVFLGADGSISALFDADAVLRWEEISEDRRSK
jgi:hypothetical protein